MRANGPTNEKTLDFCMNCDRLGSTFTSTCSRNSCRERIDKPTDSDVPRIFERGIRPQPNVLREKFVQVVAKKRSSL